MQELELGEYSWAYDPTAEYKWTRYKIGELRGPHPRNLVFAQPHINGRSLTPAEHRKIADFMEQHTVTYGK